jgi:hypothetical protein
MGVEQPAPVAHDGPLVKDALISDIEALCERRRQKYGTHLQPRNGRDALQDAYEELIDGALYLKQLIMERDAAYRGQHGQAHREGPTQDPDVEVRDQARA